MPVKVSPKYQVVIPKAVRNTLGIRPGTEIEVIAKGHVAYLVPIGTLDQLQRHLSGKVGQKNLREKRDRV